MSVWVQPAGQMARSAALDKDTKSCGPVADAGALLQPLRERRPALHVPGAH